MPSTTDNGHNSQVAANSEQGTEARGALEETTRFPAADSNGSDRVLREATRLLTAGRSRERLWEEYEEAMEAAGEES